MSRGPIACALCKHWILWNRNMDRWVGVDGHVECEDADDGRHRLKTMG